MGNTKTAIKTLEKKLQNDQLSLLQYFLISWRLRFDITKREACIILDLKESVYRHTEDLIKVPTDYALNKLCTLLEISNAECYHLCIDIYQPGKEEEYEKRFKLGSKLDDTIYNNVS